MAKVFITKKYDDVKQSSYWVARGEGMPSYMFYSTDALDFVEKGFKYYYPKWCSENQPIEFVYEDGGQ